MRQDIEVLLEEQLIFVLVLDGEKEPYVVVGDSLLQLLFRVGVLVLPEKFADGQPETVRD